MAMSGLYIPIPMDAITFLALSREQHEALNIFVSALTKEQPEIKNDQFEISIKSKRSKRDFSVKKQIINQQLISKRWKLN